MRVPGRGDELHDDDVSYREVGDGLRVPVRGERSFCHDRSFCGDPSSFSSAMVILEESAMVLLEEFKDPCTFTTGAAEDAAIEDEHDATADDADAPSESAGNAAMISASISESGSELAFDSADIYV
jgi:hypothetical protein